MTMDLVVNIVLVLFIKSNLAILYISNIGYVLAHVFALSGSLLLRRDQANWPRPGSRSALAGCRSRRSCACSTALFLVVGALAPKLNGYGTWTDFAIGIGILAGGLAAVHLPARGRGQGGRAPAGRTYHSSPVTPRYRPITGSPSPRG